MRTKQRLEGLKAWLDKHLCEGREMKSPAPDNDITIIHRQRPEVYIGWQPTRADRIGFAQDIQSNVAPCIVILPNTSHIKFVEEKRFDRFNNVHRTQELGQELSVSILFCVWEPGIRMPGFVKSDGTINGNLIKDGTEEGLFTLLGWIDDCKEALLAEKYIEGTDLFLHEETAVYSLYTDQEYAKDTRPLYYGFINATFQSYADDGNQSHINEYLK